MDKVVIFIVAWIIGTLLSGLIVMWTWNLVIPGIVGWSELSYWQAVGLSIFLSAIAGIFK